jgi:hypothetical protein
MSFEKSAGAVFERLRAVLREHAPGLVVKADEPGNYYLNVPAGATQKKELFFGAAQVKKSYVSYHLMPVYMYPDLLDDVSPELRARMQGKSCFNFRTLDDDQLRELAGLTSRSLERLRAEALP